MCRQWFLFFARALVLSVFVLAVCQSALADEKAPPAAKVAKDEFVTGRDAIAKALDTPIKIQVVDTSLEDTISDVAKQLRVRMLFDKRGLDDAGIARDVSVSLDIAGVPAREALSLLFRDHDLALLIRDNHLLVTTPEVADAALEVVTYDVTDLVMFQDAGGKWYEWGLDDLVETLTSVVRPSSWDTVGGLGSIVPCDLPLSAALVCAQTEQTHREIANLLAQLRKVESERRGVTTFPSPGIDDMLRRRLHSRELRVSAIASGGPIPSRAAVLPPNEQRDQLIRQINLFAGDIFLRLRGRSDENLFFSPAGAALALGALRLGAQGETAKELAAAMHLTYRSSGGQGWVVPEPDVLPAFAALLGSMRGEWAVDGYGLGTATKFWRPTGQRCLPTFVQNAKLLGVEVEHDAAMTPEEMRRKVDVWTADATGGALAANLTSEQASLANGGILRNVTYFHGAWQKPFSAQSTQLAPFRAGKRTGTVPMMFVRDTLDYREADGVQVVEKRYRGGAVSMVVFLPREEQGLALLEERLTAATISQYLSLLQPAEVELYLPRFRISQRHDLKAPLVELGLKTAFDREKANFKGIDETLPFYLAFCDQYALVEVDEQGTKAVAVTGMGGGFGGPAFPPKPVVFRADHPFLFLLRDVRTGAILFIGRYAVPTETAKAGA